MEINWNECQNPLTQEEKEVWLEALRSGNYKQGHKRLRRDTKYCCLGVLNEVCSLGFSATYPALQSGRDYFCLPEKVQQGLYVKNDYLKQTFAEIADFIETEINPIH